MGVGDKLKTPISIRYSPIRAKRNLNFVKKLANIKYYYYTMWRVKISIMPGSHSRRDSTRQERECEGYICLVCHILDLFLSCLEALGNTFVNQSRVKGNENVSPHCRRYCDYILVQFSNVDCGLKFSEKCGRMKLSQLSTVLWLSRVVPVS